MCCMSGFRVPGFITNLETDLEINENLQCALSLRSPAPLISTGLEFKGFVLKLRKKKKNKRKTSLDDFPLIVHLFYAEAKIFRAGLTQGSPVMCISDLDHLVREYRIIC